MNRATAPAPAASAGVVANHVRSSLREQRFLLWELLGTEQALLSRQPFAGRDRAHWDAELERARTFAHELGASYQRDDAEACQLQPDGSVSIPSAYAALWPRWRDWAQLGAAPSASETGAMPAPVKQAVMEMLMGANPSFMCYGGFTAPAARLVRQHGTPLQQRLFLERLEGYWWDACYCATEAGAGSDLLAMRAQAVEVSPGLWHLEGEKRYITAGSHGLTENTLYIVLARPAGAAAGSMFLSCYLVPRWWVDPETGETSDNHVRCTGVPDKMGLRGCPNTHLQFGVAGPTRALLLGDRRNAGLLQFAVLARQARVNTGIFAVGLASQAYLHSVQHAARRVQGRRLSESSLPEAARVPIIEHADVQRMLIDMKARTEACRALIGRVSLLSATGLTRDAEDPAAVPERKLLELLVPIVKTWCAEQCASVCDTAIQVHGGLGYTDAVPVAQYARDARILSIWEGTSYVQALLLVRDVLAYGRNPGLLDGLYGLVRSSIAARPVPEGLTAAPALLEQSLADCRAVMETVHQALQARRLDAMALHFTRIAQMFGHTLGAWCLLEAAQVAQEALATQRDSRERAFYRGKLKAARHYFDVVLPEVGHHRAAVQADAGGGLDLQLAEFACIDEELQP